MKILVTGGSGFIGSHLVDKLCKLNHEVLVIDNYSTGRRSNLTQLTDLEIIVGSIADRDIVMHTFEYFKPELVIHAAASYKDPYNWGEDVATNIHGTVNIVNASQKVDVQRIIYFQTALCYGLAPIEQPITLNHPINSHGSSYAISKTAGEQYIDLSGIDYISFRLANAYGPRNLSGPLPTFFSRLKQEKSCFVMNTRRDFIYIDDLVECSLKAVDGVGERGAYHISSGADYSIKELFVATVKAMGLPEDFPVDERERNPDDVFTILLDPSKTERDFQWKITTPLVVGVAAAVDYYREYGIQETYTHLKIDENKA